MLNPNYVKRIIAFLKNHYFPETGGDIEFEKKAKIAIAQSKLYRPETPRNLKYRKKIWNDIIKQRKLA